MRVGVSRRSPGPRRSPGARKSPGANRTVGVLAGAVALMLALAGCVTSSDSDGDGWDAAPSDYDGTLRVLAGSEVSDLEPLLQQAESALGFEIELTYQGTLTGIERVAAGDAAGRFDAVWFPSDRYLGLLDGGTDAVESPTRTMLSPIALGVKAGKAEELGWDDEAPSWSEISEAAVAGDFTYGMTNPAQSNSGFSALIGVATAFSGTGSALTSQDIDAVTPEMKDFFSGQKLTAGSSGWLADKFIEGGADVDGLVNYESVLRTLGTAAGGEEIVTVIPSDGVVTADYPIAAVAAGTDEAKEATGQLADWLTAPEQQEQIVESTERRPIDASSPLNDRFGESLLVELPFPGSLDTARTLISTFLNTVSNPSSTTYVLDVSGSMRGERMEQLKEAMGALTASESESAFTSFRNRESVALLPFNDTVRPVSEFQIPEDGDGAAERQAISGEVQALEPGGGTAIFDGLLAAYEHTERAQATNPDAFHSIVLLSDGENTDGSSYQQFIGEHGSYDDELARVPVFVILFGASDDEEMTQLAEGTGGRAFDAKSEDLGEVFKEIRGYQ